MQEKQLQTYTGILPTWLDASSSRLNRKAPLRLIAAALLLGGATLRFPSVVYAQMTTTDASPQTRQVEPSIYGFNLSRAIANYKALMRGDRKFVDLSQLEKQEIELLDRRLTNLNVDKRNPREKCVAQEIKNRGGSVSQLERGIIDLACSPG